MQDERKKGHSVGLIMQISSSRLPPCQRVAIIAHGSIVSAVLAEGVEAVLGRVVTSLC